VLELSQQNLAYRLGGSQFYLIAYALVFLLIMLLLPRGILPTIQDRLRYRRRRATAEEGDPPAAPAPRTAATKVAVGGGGRA
jgi:branched-chain amino acid transport system permease protein